LHGCSGANLISREEVIRLQGCATYGIKAPAPICAERLPHRIGGVSGRAGAVGPGARLVPDVVSPEPPAQANGEIR
jgi:hypothetical protein